MLKCQVRWDNVQCLCLTKVGLRSRSQSKIKHCMTVFHVRSISFEPLVGFTNNFAQMSSMMRQMFINKSDFVGHSFSTFFSIIFLLACITIFGSFLYLQELVSLLKYGKDVRWKQFWPKRFRHSTVYWDEFFYSPN